MHISRFIYSDLMASLSPGRASLLMGARRVGKTTLIKEITNEFEGVSRYYNCDDPTVREQFSNINLVSLKRALLGVDLVVFDEAQRIKNIGLTLKLIVDEIPDVKLLVSGSSSLDLANEITEPLTGRKKTFNLYSISFLELNQLMNFDPIKVDAYLDFVMRFGSYPKLFELGVERDKQEYLLELANDYLYKDALEYQDVRNPEQLRKLVNALALQIGQEVSYTELAGLVGIDYKTVVSYIDLLEKSYVIFRLPALSRNLRKEIRKSRKIYFFDLGIRNALIRNFNSYDLRNDRGQVWENFLVAERMKRNIYRREFKNYYFWRTYDKKEIDLIEEVDGKFFGYEFKWMKSKLVKPREFLDSYPESDISLINKFNYLDFLI